MLVRNIIHFLLERIKTVRLFLMLDALLFWVKTARENQQLHVVSKVKIIVLNSLIRMEINLKVIVQIFIFLMNDLYISIFFQNKTIFCRKGLPEGSGETLEAINAYHNSESVKAEKYIFKDMMRSDSRQNASVEGFAQAENNAGTKSDNQDVRGGGCSVGLSRNLEAHKSVIDLMGNMRNFEDFINALEYISMGIVLEGEEYDPNIILENINSLIYQVFGRDYISLAPGVQEGKYRALIQDGEVPLSKLSTGERNVLALCYFFAYIMNGNRCGSIEEFLKRDQIIVLDDPISSFDGNNKYGMTVLLVYLFRIILSSESKAKLIIMTHDSSLQII